MQPEKFFVASRGSARGICRTPHEDARPAAARGVCQSCLNSAYAKIAEEKATDEGLVQCGFWLPKEPTISDYIDQLLLKKEA
jgi:hypothetical protein